MDRRRFLIATGTAFTALIASRCIARPSAHVPDSGVQGYGPLQPDPHAVLDLPEGFHYRVLSQLGDPMNDGATVPDKADGMGCFALGEDEIVLVRNHELVPTDDAGGAIAHGFGTRNGEIVPGGTTHLVLDAQTLDVRRQFA